MENLLNLEKQWGDTKLSKLIFAAMNEVVNGTPNTGNEGSKHHLRSETASHIIQDYTLYSEEDNSEMMQVRLTDAANAMAMWLNEDAETNRYI